MTPKRATRRRRNTTRKMPSHLTMADVTSVSPWPLGSVKTNTCKGENWTDVVIHLDDRIRLGGKYNSRRVRYDGRFYITHNGSRVVLVGELAWCVLDHASHVYGLDRDADVAHNVRLKGY